MNLITILIDSVCSLIVLSIFQSIGYQWASWQFLSSFGLMMVVAVANYYNGLCDGFEDG